MARRLIVAENRMKMNQRETPWGKFVRLNELARHRARIRQMQPGVDDRPPHEGPRQRMNRERSDLEQVLGGASNWIGKYQKGVKKLTDCRPWSVPKVLKDDPAPFSTLKIQPRDVPKPPKKSEKELYKMRVIEKSIMGHKQRIKKISRGPSVYTPKNRTYLVRGEAPWYHKASDIHTIDEKLKEIRKWRMRHRVKTPPAPPTGLMAYLATFFSTPDPESKVESVSSVTEEDAARDPHLAQLKDVQEAGDPEF